MNISKKRKNFVHLRWYCRGIIVATAALSIWANILHAGGFSLVTWTFAAMPPLLVLGGWELVSRIPIRKDAAWFIRLARPVATAGIAGAGGWLSYWHQRAAVLRYTGDDQAGFMLPLLIDGLMVIASVSVYELNAHLLNLEAAEAGSAVRTGKPKVDAAPKRDKGPNSKERIAQILAKAPELSIKDIAAAAGTSYNYAYTVVTELRKQPEPVSA
jgi:hypothetical protein